jgi:hypothetical protein
MTKSAAALLLIGFWLLALATSASAECAWVFWLESSGPPTYESSTSTVSAWGTKQECEQALTKKLRSDSSSLRAAKGEVTVDEIIGKPRVIWRAATRSGALITTFTYICLPDTVDPRGPKGK